eukprot:232647-Rhodomonas_salina.1
MGSRNGGRRCLLGEFEDAVVDVPEPPARRLLHDHLERVPALPRLEHLARVLLQRRLLLAPRQQVSPASACACSGAPVLLGVREELGGYQGRGFLVRDEVDAHAPHHRLRKPHRRALDITRTQSILDNSSKKG